MEKTILKTKGQITLPMKIRERFGVNVGDIFEVEISDGKIILNPKKLINSNKKEDFDISKYIGIANGIFGDSKAVKKYLDNERNSWN